MNRAQKVLILIAALSYAVYGFYWLVKGSFWFLETALFGYQFPATGILRVNATSLFAAYLMDYAAFFGLIARAVGGLFAVLVVYQIFRTQSDHYLAVKGYILKVLICESIYFLAFIPSIIFLISFSALTSLSIFYLATQLTVQILFIVPCLVMLATKIKKPNPSGALKWTTILFLNYIFALWLSYQLKWLELFNGAQVNFSTCLGWLIENARLLSFLNSTVIFSAALVFAFIATKYVLASRRVKAVRMWSLSALFVGLFFVFYVLYCIYLGVYWVIPFGEIWLIPLLFVGSYFLIHKPKFKPKKS
ncbi:MAG: hypothetical protein ACQCN3_15020 [Candidatus Bathyarchaeia archaeon]|jgi:hypothetical protein